MSNPLYCRRRSGSEVPPAKPRIWQTPNEPTTSRSPEAPSAARLLTEGIRCAADIERGWQATLDVAAGEGWRVQAVAIAGLVHIELDVAYVRGDTTPDGAVTVTVLDRNGNETNRWQTTATDSGQFGVRLVKSGAEKDGEVMTLDPGTVMGVDLTGSGDPMLFVVPELTALADIDREEIVGTAPPGHRVAVEVRGTSQVIARSVPAQVEAGGRYVSSLTGVHDVEPGSVGRLTATRPDGHQWSVSWAAPRTTLDLAGGSLSVTASTNQSVRLRLLDPHGVERGTAAWRMRLTTSFNRIVTGIAPFSDRFGRTVVAVPGDTVEGRIGTGSVQFRVLRLEAAASVADDAIQGSTDAPPGSSLRLAAIDVGAASIVRTLIVPADGAFVFDLTRPSDPEGPFDLRFNTTVSLRLDHRAHRFLLDVTVPGLNLGLSGPRLSGTLAPRAEGVVNWLRGGRSLGTTRFVADSDGAFDVDLRGADGMPFALEAVDELTLDGLDHGVAPAIRLTVPRLARAHSAVGGGPLPAALTRAWPSPNSGGGPKTACAPQFGVHPAPSIGGGVGSRSEPGEGASPNCRMRPSNCACPTATW